MTRQKVVLPIKKNIIKLEEQASRNIIKFINKMQNIGLTSYTAVSQIGKTTGEELCRSLVGPGGQIDYVSFVPQQSLRLTTQ